MIRNSFILLLLALIICFSLVVLGVTLQIPNNNVDEPKENVDEPKEIIYAESIELLDENLKVDENGEKYVVIRPDENGERKYQIKYRVHPDNATEDGVTFAYDEQNTSVTVDETGVVTFAKEGVVTVQIIAKDGSAKTSIKIISR